MGKWKKAIALMLLLTLLVGLPGCASLQSGIHDLHGSIIGNE